MSLESIIGHILDKAGAQREEIIQKAFQQKETVLHQARQQAEKIYQEFIDKERSFALAQKQRLIVNARLEQKKALLKTKQELIDTVFEKFKATLKEDEFKKQQIFQDKAKEVPEDIDFYLKKIRQDYENEIAKILFPY